METLKEFLNNLKERLASPLLFSFLIAWLVYNWQVVLAIFWLDPPGTFENYRLLVDHIRCQLGRSSFLVPLGYACLYTFFAPLVSNVISAFRTWTEGWGVKWNLWINEENSVPFEKFLKLKNTYDENTKKLRDLIVNESQTSEQLEQTKSELIKARQDLSESLRNLNAYQVIVSNFNNVTIMDGVWERQVQGDTITRELLKFQQSIVYSVESGNEVYRISNLTHNASTNSINFVLLEKEGNSAIATNFLAFTYLSKEGSLMTGGEIRRGGSFRVTYKKITEP